MPDVKRPAGKGFTLIELVVVIAVLAIVAGVAVPEFIDIRRDVNDRQALASIREIVGAQVIFQALDREEDGSLDYATSLFELGNEGLISDDLASGELQGYCFVVFSRSAESWHAHAAPAAPEDSGGRFFYVDETRVIRAEPDGEAGPDSLPISGEGEPSPSTDHRDREPPICRKYRGDGESTLDRLPGLITQTLDHLGALGKKSQAPVVDAGLGIAKRPGFAQLVFKTADTDRDGALSIDEILNANMLGIARQIEPDVFPNPPTQDPVLGKDSEIDRVIDWFLKKVAHSLQLGIANEKKFPSIPYANTKPPGTSDQN